MARRFSPRMTLLYFAYAFGPAIVIGGAALILHFVKAAGLL